VTDLLIDTRDVPPRTAHALESAGVPTLLARLFAARGVRSIDELDDGLGKLLPPAGLQGAAQAATRLADALRDGERICIVADYDCDGATACAVALRGLQLLGVPRERLAYVVPDRAVHGYGLTPAIVDLAAQQRPPDVLVTVDNGIASLDGVAHARAQGHGGGGDRPPPAGAARRRGGASRGRRDRQPQPARLRLREQEPRRRRRDVLRAAGRCAASCASAGVFSAEQQPRLDALLDLVALGTVADVVKLDANNRRLVAQGLRRIRGGRMQARAGGAVRRGAAATRGGRVPSTSASRSGRASMRPGAWPT
jgi:single-stranded-DNA-specific exonuclease